MINVHILISLFSICIFSVSRNFNHLQKSGLRFDFQQINANIYVHTFYYVSIINKQWSLFTSLLLSISHTLLMYLLQKCVPKYTQFTQINEHIKNVSVQFKMGIKNSRENYFIFLYGSTNLAPNHELCLNYLKYLCMCDGVSYHVCNCVCSTSRFRCFCGHVK